MSPTKGWFESDDDYRSRVAKEANEKTIEASSGSAPSKGWFETDNDYRDRISRESDEYKIRDSSGTAPSKGWFESNDDYRDRIHRESNERTVEDSTGSAPSKGWFESDNDYETRIRKEANEHIIEAGTSSRPKKGWFEGDHDYRSRVAHEARELQADGRSKASTSGHSNNLSSYRSNDTGASTSGASTGLSGGFIVVIVLVVSLLFASLSGQHERDPASQVVKLVEQPRFDPPPRFAQERTPQQLCMQSWLISMTDWLKEMVCEDKELMELNRRDLAMHEERIKVEGESRRIKIEGDRKNLELVMGLCPINGNQTKRDCVEQKLRGDIEQLTGLIGYRLP